MTNSSSQNLPTWPAAELHLALSALGTAAGLLVQERGFFSPPAGTFANQPEKLTQWLSAASAHIGLESEHFTVRHRDLDRVLRSNEPIILSLPLEDEENARFLAVLKGNKRTVTFIGPDFKTRQVKTDRVISALVSSLEYQPVQEIRTTLQTAGLDPNRSQGILQSMLNERLANTPVTTGWHLRLPTASSFWSHFRRDNLLLPAVGFITTYSAQNFLWLLSWWILGRAFFEGRFDTGWAWGWVLTLVTIIPLRAAATWLQGLTAIGVGGILKKRLLAGALKMEPDETRHQGIGQLLGRVLESEAVESLLLNGGFLTLAGLIELLFAAAVLSQGIIPTTHLLLLGIWLLGGMILTFTFWRRRQIWTDQRLMQTHYLVEQISGHKTRLAQTSPEDWHKEEDEMLSAYAEQSTRLDHIATWLLTAVTRGWLILGAAATIPYIINPPPDGQILLAISLGGLLSAGTALTKYVNGSLQLSDALIAAEKIIGLYRAAGRSQLTGIPSLAVKQQLDTQTTTPLLAAHHITFRYRSDTPAVLQNINLEIFAGDHILLESGSGGGKSTLAALLSGIRTPESGLILLNGLDRQTIGQDGWRRSVATAPQFHENHIVLGTFAFNLLMGRPWPPTLEDMARAQQVCADLGLDELLEKMPAGMGQIIGDTGWQLSHGEQSRLFLARAILQDADLLIFDESFAALDPQNLSRCLQTVLDQQAAVLVIAHP